MASLADEKYIAFTTYKKDGTAKATPTWVVGLDGGKLGFWTSSASWKAKRLANNPKVVVQPSDARGRLKPGSTPSTGTAVVVTGADLAAISVKVKAKYGFMTKLTKVFNTLGHLFKKGKFPYGDVGVVITLDS
jgi:uncharacterized protein